MRADACERSMLLHLSTLGALCVRVIAAQITHHTASVFTLRFPTLLTPHTKVAEAPADVAEPAAAEEAGEEEAVEEVAEEEEEEEEPKPEIKLGTAPPDLRFPHTNQVSGARRAYVTIASEHVNLMPGRRLLTMSSR